MTREGDPETGDFIIWTFNPCTDIVCGDKQAGAVNKFFYYDLKVN